MANLRSTLTPRILLFLLVLLPALRPGDASWVNDEPLMMELALRYNNLPCTLYGIPLPFTPSPVGLQGTRGLRYGPLPVWLDQILLAFTHNLLVMVSLRAILFSAIIALALDSLAKTLGLSPWFAVVTLLSPFIFLYSRALWDSTWCIPISALLLASYARFLSNPRPGLLILTILCCFFLPLIHMMNIPIVLVVLLHLLIFHREKLWKWNWQVGLSLAISIYLTWPYFYFVFTHLHPGAPPDQSPLFGWFFPLFGGTFQTFNISGTLPDWQNSVPNFLAIFIKAATWISLVAHPIVWLGMILAAPKAWSAIRRIPTATVTDHLSLIALSVWLCQSILDGIARIYATWHYYSGTWCVYVFFAWIAARWLRTQIGRRIFVPALALYAASLLFGIGMLSTLIAQNAGARYINFGTTLGNQIAAVQQLRRYSDDSIAEFQIPQWKSFPWALKILMEMNPPSTDIRPRRMLTVKYRDAWPTDAHIQVEEFPAR